jgi:broad specificity phosphatase PhoE
MAYITELEKRIHYYHLQEHSTPEKFAGKYRDTDPAEWQRARLCWEEWMGEAWNAVAIAHAGRNLSDSEIVASYGEWKDRESEPGIRLFRIIMKDRRLGQEA